MHICFLNMQIEYYSPVSGGAIATIIMQHARTLLAHHHKVSVLTPVNGDETYDIGNVVPLQTGSRKNLNFFQRRISDVRRKLHGWDYPYCEYYQRSFMDELEKLAPEPEAVILHNDLVSPRYIKKALPRTKIVLALQNEQRTNLKNIDKELSYIDLFAPVGDYIQDWTAKTYHIPPGKFVKMGNGVELDLFSPRENFLESRSPLRVLCIDRLDPNKGPDIAVDAVGRLRKEGVQISITVAGALWFYGYGNQMENPYFRELSGKMDAAQADYLGHVTRPNVPALIRDHDVVCVLSRSHDPYPLVTLEAMASGCAVVASDRGGLPEASSGAAMLVNPDDFEAVVECLRSLATNPALLRSQKEKSVKRASTQTWVGKTAILEDMLAQRLGICR